MLVVPLGMELQVMFFLILYRLTSWLGCWLWSSRLSSWLSMVLSWLDSSFSVKSYSIWMILSSNTWTEYFWNIVLSINSHLLVLKKFDRIVFSSSDIGIQVLDFPFFVFFKLPKNDPFSSFCVGTFIFSFIHSISLLILSILVNVSDSNL